jgi:hypothetical protein
MFGIGGGMFGQDDNQQHGGQDWQQPQDQSQVVTPAQDTPHQQDSTTEIPSEPETAPAVPEDTIPSATDWQQPSDSTETVGGETPNLEQPAAPIDAPTPQSTQTSASSDLLDIKQKALEELSPLVGHLEQTPEEKFKTTMMMIQASDNQALVPDAYTAAQAITDEKAKAQALLDIVNEINYFTQHTQ